MKGMEWGDRMYAIAEVLLALGDTPTQPVVRQFVREMAREEMRAYRERPPEESSTRQSERGALNGR